MTDLTARELIDTILRSLAQTRATFKKASPLVDNPANLQSNQKELRPDETTELGRQ
jgi:hypothetical protein